MKRRVLSSPECRNRWKNGPGRWFMHVDGNMRGQSSHGNGTTGLMYMSRGRSGIDIDSCNMVASSARQLAAGRSFFAG
jgi:hypothetical protein